MQRSVSTTRPLLLRYVASYVVRASAAHYNRLRVTPLALFLAPTAAAAVARGLESTPPFRTPCAPEAAARPPCPAANQTFRAHKNAIAAIFSHHGWPY
eukprot:6207112-Pleurochrysis_carterae.AAC.2